MAQDGPDDPDLAGLLMGARCDPAQVDPYGETALENAKDHNRPAIAALLAAVASPSQKERERTLAPFRAEVAALRQLVAELVRRGRVASSTEAERLLEDTPDARYALATRLMAEYLTYPLSSSALVPFNVCALGALVPWVAPALAPVCGTAIDS